ncbi:ABC transporter ATP-binding protein [Lacticaseibacillus hulanensis]|uniref:ABC transporter ATP-binding protein n=1 Tax=Lacticaseibacillus hulanensis TaxID=2493111 RepID=UPI000FD9983C|nr:ABC transporter ATP-binding protein [Lacticaseibacillus hulanensis]
MRLNHYFVRHWHMGLLVSLLLIVGTVLNTAYTITLGNILTALGHHSATGVVIWMASTGVVLILYCLQCYIEPVVEMHTNEAMGLSVRRDITTRLAHTSAPQFHQRPVPEYVSWLTNDLATINDYGFENTWMAFGQALQVVIGGAALLHYNWSLTVLVIALSLLMLLVPRFFTKKMNAANAAVSTANEHLTTVATDLLSGFGQLLMLNQTTRLTAGVQGAGQQRADKRVAYAKASNRFYAVNRGAVSACMLAVLILTAYLYLHGKVPLGVFSTSESLAGAIFSSVMGLTENLAERQTVQPLLDKYQAVPTTDDTQGKPTTPLHDALVLDHVSFHYPDNDQATLTDISYEFCAGQHYAITGPSGIGKSTLLKLIDSNLEPTGGQILFDGQPLATIAARSLHDQIAVVDQQPLLFNTTLRDNLLLGRAASTAEITAVLTQVGLTTFVNQLPNGLDTSISFASAKLSGGQKQRIAIARALLAGRSVLLLDEATASLDAPAAKAIDELVLSLPLTVISVTHHLTDATAQRLDGVLALSVQK